MLYCDQTTIEDLHELVTFLRPEDAHEASLVAGEGNVLPLLLEQWAHGEQVMTSVIQESTGKLVACGGYDQIGQVWLLCTDLQLTFRERREFLGLIRAWLDHALKLFPCLFNVVLKSNEKHVQLLRAMGAHFGEPQVIAGEEFLLFNIWREDQQWVL